MKHSPQDNSQRTYLNCPYDEKDACKAIGGRWDPEKKKWYVPTGINPAPFEKWLPEY
jgi:hypothetical protein